MLLPIIQYGHPTLRQKGARLETITPAIQKLIDDMFETMEEAKGVGLAAQQVAQALQLTVLDVRGITDRPSTLFLDGQPADVDAFMPLVLINPQVKGLGESASGPEGCLSFPEMYADISRPEQVEVEALDRQGRPIKFRCGGLLARAVQHEVDHLNGILFIDRMSNKTRAELQPELDHLQNQTRAALKKT